MFRQWLSVTNAVNERPIRGSIAARRRTTKVLHRAPTPVRDVSSSAIFSAYRFAGCAANRGD
jgi:hypothetical protein